MSGRYIGLNRGHNAIALHNSTVPADQEADACRCPQCTGLRDSGLPDLNAPLTDAERIAGGLDPANPISPSAAAPVAEPAAALLACPADARRPKAVVISNPDRGPALSWLRQRGPVQDESGRVHPIDAAAMRTIEGRTIVHDMIDAGALL